ncbi:MAG: thrombospondin type 3 repeat-containing protein [Thermoplasmata archaeon]|nr:MAG: thrombospondin type 3 repeat-containing protein [Thermoplasmata archaeon]
MRVKLPIVCIVLILLLASTPNVVSKDVRPYYYQPSGHYFHGSIWLYPGINQTSGELMLYFGHNPDYFYYDDYDSYYYDLDIYAYNEDIFGQETYWDSSVEIGPNENITFSITRIMERFYNPDIEWDFSLNTWIDPWDYSIPDFNITYQLRVDSDGDNNYEYIADYTEDLEFWNLESTSTTGEPIDLINGTIELGVSRTDNLTVNYVIDCSPFNSYIQIPFDLDTDCDGLSDYSDSDDDNDGHSDRNDWFPINPKEWRDTDRDGIGDNEDKDYNGNGIPDHLEIPLVICIILIPVVVISASMKYMKKKKSKKKESREEIKTITSSKLGPKNR